MMKGVLLLWWGDDARGSFENCFFLWEKRSWEEIFLLTFLTSTKWEDTNYFWGIVGGSGFALKLHVYWKVENETQYCRSSLVELHLWKHTFLDINQVCSYSLYSRGAELVRSTKTWSYKNSTIKLPWWVWDGIGSWETCSRGANLSTGRLSNITRKIYNTRKEETLVSLSPHY